MNVIQHPSSPLQYASTPRVILLDRDGVLNINLATYTRTPDELTLAPYAGEAVTLLRKHHYLPLVITNQAGVGRGIIAPDVLDSIHHSLNHQLGALGGTIEQFYVCPHTREAACGCRKPAPGLLIQAQRDHQFEFATTWFVGDATRDTEAARAVGCKMAMVRTAGFPTISDVPPGVPFFETLLDFVHYLLENP